MCECYENLEDGSQDCGCVVPASMRDVIAAEITRRILPGLAALVEARDTAQAELQALEAEKERLQRRMIELTGQGHRLKQDTMGGEVVRRLINEASDEVKDIREKLALLKTHQLEPARSRAFHAVDDLNMAAQRAIRPLHTAHQARLLRILDEAERLADGWGGAIAGAAREAGIDFGKSRLNPLAHGMYDKLRFGNAPFGQGCTRSHEEKKNG